jgi:hypothetical protein
MILGVWCLVWERSFNARHDTLACTPYLPLSESELLLLLLLLPLLPDPELLEELLLLSLLLLLLLLLLESESELLLELELLLLSLLLELRLKHTGVMTRQTNVAHMLLPTFTVHSGGACQPKQVLPGLYDSTAPDPCHCW